MEVILYCDLSQGSYEPSRVFEMRQNSPLVFLGYTCFSGREVGGRGGIMLVSNTDGACVKWNCVAAIRVYLNEYPTAVKLVIAQTDIFIRCEMTLDMNHELVN